MISGFFVADIGEIADIGGGNNPDVVTVWIDEPHQQIGVKLLAIIGFTPYYWQLLAIIAIIGYYWLLFFLHKFLYYWLLLRQAPSLIIAIIGILLLQLLVPLPIICIIGNYWQLLILI